MQKPDALANVPSRHPFQSLDTPIRVPLALQESLLCVHDLLSLPLQVAQRSCTNFLGLQRDSLRLAKSPGRSAKSLGSGKELLALLQLVICGRIICVAGSEECAAVARKGFQLAFGGVDVGFKVAEAGVDLALRRRRNVGFLEAHLAELLDITVSSRVF